MVSVHCGVRAKTMGQTCTCITCTCDGCGVKGSGYGVTHVTPYWAHSFWQWAWNYFMRVRRQNYFVCFYKCSHMLTRENFKFNPYKLWVQPWAPTEMNGKPLSNTSEKHTPYWLVDLAFPTNHHYGPLPLLPWNNLCQVVDEMVQWQVKWHGEATE